jgi:DNA-binding transcriptional ArsR family regulator
MAEEMGQEGERDICQLISLFSTPLRRQIIRLLSSGESYTFTDILNYVSEFDGGVRSNNLSYHLKELRGLVDQDDRSHYVITAKGRYVKEILDDLEEVSELPEEMPDEGDDPLESGIEKIVIGGMMAKVRPENFMELVRQRGSLVLHSRIGTFRPKNLYLCCIGGMNFYCKMEGELPELDRVSEVSRVEVPKNMIVDV